MTAPILFKEDLGQRRYDLDWVRTGAFIPLIFGMLVIVPPQSKRGSALSDQRNIPGVYSSPDGHRCGGACP